MLLFIFLITSIDRTSPSSRRRPLEFDDTILQLIALQHQITGKQNDPQGDVPCKKQW
jgi:hypothetical protein